MAMHIEPQPAPPRRWWLGWGLLCALGLLCCQPTPTYAQNIQPVWGLPDWLSGNNSIATTIAWGDVDGDGDLDLAIGYDESPVHIYLNHNGHLETELDQPWTVPDQVVATSVAWADIDHDGRLDLAVGNPLGSSLLYLNRGLDANGKLSMTLSQTLATGPTQSLAWGDVDGNGWLDLAVGNDGAPNQIYLNTGEQLALAWTAPVTDTAKTTSVALGDVTGDGRLDLVVGNSRVMRVGTNICSAPCAGQPNKVYRNDGILANQLQFTAVWTATVVDNTTGVALGDINGDGKLDLAVGSQDVFSDSDTDFFEGNVKLYTNSGSSPFYATAWQSAEPLNTSGIALGDVNGDGKLDLVAANRWNDHKVYLNQNAGLATTGLSATGDQNDDVSAVALGDMDGDGKLDLALAIARASSRVHMNQSTSWQRTTFDSNGGFFHQVAWGDVDGDGDLDLAVGNDEQANKVYLNVSGQLSTTPAWTAPVTETTTSIAWGDLEGDGDLDLAVGNNEQLNKVYLNVNGQLSTTPAWTAPVTETTASIAWGDLEGDGDLDLAVGNVWQPNKVYLNVNGQLSTTPAWTDNVDDPTYSLAWGDMDGDGDLDLAVGNRYGNNKVYRNSGGQLETTPIWTARVFEITHSVAWGDMDGDGDLDLAVGNGFGESNRIYRNQNGILETVASWTSLDYEDTSAVAWGDMDGDGDLDLAVANRSSSATRPSGIYLNRSGELEHTPQTLPVLDADDSASVAWGDVNGDGALDLALGDASWGYNSLFVNQRPAHLLYPGRASAGINLQAPDTPANFFAAAKIHNEPVIPFTYTLYHPASLPVAQVRAVYSVDGGGHWYPALAASGTITQNLLTVPYPTKTVTNTYRFNWDVGASGFFGQSDNVILRLVALPSLRPVANNIAGPFQQGPATAQTFPLRVRGQQVRVVSAQTNRPISSTLVYRLPAGQATGALPIDDQAGTPYHTDGQGYLQGRGQLAIGDRLVALAPITATASYTLYYTSAAPTLIGLNVYTVTTAGVQTLTVSAANPLLLFNLEVALEWDARKDTAFLNQLQFDLRRTSEFLFDATDGQAALGEITLYHNKEQWERADLRIYASNALIPNADPGGIVTSEVSEIIASNPFIGATTPYSITYQPGRIRMGAVWNRFGEATGTLGEDWPRTLAHEIGHYAFYLYDNYLGLKDGVVAPVDTCTGTLMTDQYREDFSEFHTVDNWAAACGQTVSAQRSGRSDWQTITRFYPWLKMPGAQPNPGPVTLPLAVTQIKSRFATTPTLPLDVAVFDLVDGNGAAQVSGPHAQAVLYTGDGRLLDLGHPVVDKLEARGAHVGDRLCVYDLQAERLGCETVAANDNYLTLAQKAGWQPEIVVSPVTSRTVSVLVSNVTAGLTLQGKLYPENSAATAVTDFVPWTSDAYSTTFQLATGVLAGHIQVWVNETDSPANPRRESLTSYALGGSPGKLKKPPKGNKRTLDSTTQAGSEDVTPAIAPDGQVLIYGNVSFSDGEFYALQKVNRLPVAPLWTTVVGDGYRILKSAKAPDLVNTSILFRYRGQDVPAGEESFLSLYFWEEPKQQWRKLPTVLNRAVNEASAQAPGPGLYVLMSSLEIPLQQAGWNLLAYPVQQTRPVTEALASITGNYSLVYSYVITDTVDSWKLYAPDAPAYVNDLQSLRFGQGYWINARQPITWLIKGPDQATLQAAATQSLPMPPATFYGVVLPGNGLTPAVGQPVQALINGVRCGQSQTQLFAGQIVYSLNVVGDGTGNPACIGAGQRVLITVAGLPLEEVFWQNDVAQPVVSNGPKIYLPTIWR